ncbi:Uncharacterised protein [Moellerella wisconsensis]|nr:Uncharacterised protein [Moellerella wisconsensis]
MTLLLFGHQELPQLVELLASGIMYHKVDSHQLAVKLILVVQVLSLLLLVFVII